MVRPKGRNPEKKRQQILDAAIWILSRKLYYQCPISEIAKRAGVAKGTVYLYFSSKEELYFSIIFMLMDKMKEFVKSMTENKIVPSKRLFILLEKQSYGKDEIYSWL